MKKYVRSHTGTSCEERAGSPGSTTLRARWNAHKINTEKKFSFFLILKDRSTESEPQQFGLLWDYGFGRTHFPAGGLIRASRGIFYLPALLPPCPRPASHPSPPSPRGRRGALSVRRRAAQDSTAEGRGFSFVDQPDATDQQNKPPCSVFMKPRKIEKILLPVI